MWPSNIRDLTLLIVFSWFIWAPLGRWMLRHMGLGESAGWHSLSIAAGMGAWGLMVLGLGLAGWLKPAAFAALIAAVLLLARKDLRWRPVSLWPSNPAHGSVVLTALLSAVNLVFFVIVLASALAPELSFDALNVHLPYARAAAESQRLSFVPNNWSSVMPALPLMSYVTAFVFSGPALAKLFNVLCYLACGFLLYSYLRGPAGFLPALVAATLFWSCPVALYEATTALIDLPLALFSAISVLSLLEWTDRGRSSHLWLSAAALGLALGSKYHAVFWVPPIALIIIWHLGRVRKASSVALLKYGLGYSAIVLLLFLPWAARAWFYTGNPVFPAANGIFRSPYFTPAMESAAQAAYENEGVGRSPAAILSLPWTVSVRPGPFRGSLGPVFLLGTLLALLRLRSGRVRYGLLLAGGYFYAWAWTAQEIRYLLPLAPLLAMLSSIGFLGPDQRVPGEEARLSGVRFPHARSVAAAAAIVAVLVAAAANLPGVYRLWVEDWTYWHGYREPFSYLTGRESALDYLRRDIPSIDVYEFANRNLSTENRILLLNDASQFYSRVPTLYSFTLEGERILFEATEAGVMSRLKESRITHVLLNYNGIAPLPGVAPRQGVYFFLEEGFQRRNLETVFSSNNVVLYRVRTS